MAAKKKSTTTKVSTAAKAAAPTVAEIAAEPPTVEINEGGDAGADELALDEAQAKQAVEELNKVLDSIQKRRLASLELQQQAIQQTIDLAGDAAVRKIASVLPRVTAIADNAKTRLDEIESQRRILTEMMTRARATVSGTPPKRRIGGR